MFEMQSILVTGAAGFIGSNVAARLARAGHRVVGCDLAGREGAGELARARVRALLDPAQVRCVALDLADGDALDHLCAVNRFDTIVHLAAQVGARRSRRAPAEFVQTNLVGFAQVLETCRRHRVGRLLYAGQGNADRDASGRAEAPRSFYAATMAANEMMAGAYAHEHGLQALAMRFHCVYGPWARPDLLPVALAEAIRHGHPMPLTPDDGAWHDRTYVDDAAAAVLALVDRPEAWAGVDAIELTQARPVGMVQLVRALESTLGRQAIWPDAPLPEGPASCLWPEGSRLRSLIGDWPDTPLNEGLAAMVRWLDEWSPMPAPWPAAA
jgi:UDP-glucuronate 4-epimerase